MKSTKTRVFISLASSQRRVSPECVCDPLLPSPLFEMRQTALCGLLCLASLPPLITSYTLLLRHKNLKSACPEAHGWMMAVAVVSTIILVGCAVMWWGWGSRVPYRTRVGRYVGGVMNTALDCRYVLPLYLTLLLVVSNLKHEHCKDAGCRKGLHIVKNWSGISVAFVAFMLLTDCACQRSQGEMGEGGM